MKGDVTKLIFKSDKKMSQRYQYSTKRPLMHLTQVRQLRQRSQIGPLWGLWPWGTGVAVRGTAGGAVEGAIRDVVGVRGVVGVWSWYYSPGTVFLSAAHFGFVAAVAGREVRPT